MRYRCDVDFRLYGRGYMSTVRLVRDCVEFSESERFGCVRGGFITIEAPSLSCISKVHKDDSGHLSQVPGQILVGPEEDTLLFNPDYVSGYTDIGPLTAGAQVRVWLVCTLTNLMELGVIPPKDRRGQPGLLVLYRSLKSGLYRRLGCRFRCPDGLLHSLYSKGFDKHFEKARIREFDVE